MLAMSIVFEILEGLWNMNLNYKGVRVNFFGVPRFLLDGKNEGSVRSAFSRLKHEGHIAKGPNGWKVTASGKTFLEQKRNILRCFRSSFKKTSPRNLLVMFDIPESRKTERHWFRWHLKKFNYIMIQKSVWVGPSPLPKEFTDYVKEIKLNSCIKTFKLARSYL